MFRYAVPKKFESSLSCVSINFSVGEFSAATAENSINLLNEALR